MAEIPCLLPVFKCCCSEPAANRQASAHIGSTDIPLDYKIVLFLNLLPQHPFNPHHPVLRPPVLEEPLARASFLRMVECSSLPRTTIIIDD